LDPETIEAPQSNTDNSCLAQQAEFSTPLASKPRPRRQARGKAATPASPHLTSPPAPAKPSLPANAPPNDNPSDAHKSQKPPRKKNARKKKPKAKDESMTQLRKEAYVPPHLRNHKSANGAKADSGHSGTAANGSPAASDKSKATFQTKLHSSP
jgi:hypothetical protein